VCPDAQLPKAFGRDRCADQPTIQRTLNAFGEENVSQLREAVEVIQARLCRVFSHDYFAAEGMLILEVDHTGLKASKARRDRPRGTSPESATQRAGSW
jgi:hypothetical protein